MIPITKIQILADKGTGHPLFYCHAEDRDHAPVLTLNATGSTVEIRARRILYKVKFNPQHKNRVDIYMSLEQARLFGGELLKVAPNAAPKDWITSRADPAAAAKGNMHLPSIIWARSARYLRAGARVDTGTQLSAVNGYINLDLEYPHESHIKMKQYEIHIGITIGPPSGIHDDSKASIVHVPEHELQRGRNETNPLKKTVGDFYIELQANLAAGLGTVLSTVLAPNQASGSTP